MSAAASNKSIEVVTVQSASIKNVFETLKDILFDANLRFGKDEIKILEANPTKTLFVHMSLKRDAFDKYECPKKRIIGVNLTYLYRPMKTISSGDVLSIKINSNSDEKSSNDTVTLEIENEEKGKSLACNINLMDINISNMGVQDLDYDSAISMPSEELQNICKSMLSFDITVVDIRNIMNVLNFSGESDSGKYEYSYKADTGGEKSDAKGEKSDIEIKSKNKNVIQGYFSLKYLSQLTRCTNLSSTVTLFLGNNMPLTVQYDVGSMGQIKFVLAPKSKVDGD